MSTKKRDDEEFAFDPLEALADIVTGDAFTFFDPPETPNVTKEVENAVTDSRAAGANESSGNGTGGNGRAKRATGVPAVVSKPAIESVSQPVSSASKKGEATGKQESSEGGNVDGGGKEGTPEPSATK